MNFISYFNKDRRRKVATRNEGKIKSYESCVDVRAWSHDIRTRDRYLRDWIKCDMPIYLIPVCTLASILSIMKCRSRGKLGSRCHQGCQSKILLASISSSCSAMKDCLKKSGDFEKYFNEEEFETIHWPCARCLEILKSIKMFWKIVVEKVIGIQIPKTNQFDSLRKHKSADSIKNIAHEWQKEMVNDAIYIKSNTILLKHIGNTNCTFERYSHRNQCPIDLQKSLEINEVKACIYYDYDNKATETDCKLRSVAIQKDGKSVCQKVCKCTSDSIKKTNLERDVHNDKKDDIMMIYKNNIQNLQQKCNLQQREVDRLKKENMKLNFELQRVCKNRYNFINNDTAVNKSVALAPSSSDNNSEREFDSNSAKKIDSEIIITLKNCKNENFRHVSMLQVLHKTNEEELSRTNCSGYEKEDPVNLLNKVHEKFGAIVSREIDIANKTNKNSKNNEVIMKTTFRKFRDCRLPPSASSSSYSFTSGSCFESANETNDSSVKPGTFNMH